MSASGSSCLLTQTMDGRIVRGGIISSCQSAATDCKAVPVTRLYPVRSAIGSTELYLNAAYILVIQHGISR